MSLNKLWEIDDFNFYKEKPATNIVSAVIRWFRSDYNL